MLNRQLLWGTSLGVMILFKMIDVTAMAKTTDDDISLTSHCSEQFVATVVDSNLDTSLSSPRDQQEILFKVDYSQSGIYSPKRNFKVDEEYQDLFVKGQTYLLGVSDDYSTICEAKIINRLSAQSTF